MSQGWILIERFFPHSFRQLLHNWFSRDTVVGFPNNLTIVLTHLALFLVSQLLLYYETVISLFSVTVTLWNRDLTLLSDCYSVRPLSHSSQLLLCYETVISLFPVTVILQDRYLILLTCCFPICVNDTSQYTAIWPIYFSFCFCLYLQQSHCPCMPSTILYNT